MPDRAHEQRQARSDAAIPARPASEKSIETCNSRSTSGHVPDSAKITTTSPSSIGCLRWGGPRCGRPCAPPRPEHPSGKSMSRIRLPGDRRGRQHLRLDHLGLGIADGIDRAHPAVADVAQDRADGGRARVDVGVDAQRRPSGTSVGSLISAMAIGQPSALARTAASMLVLSSSVTQSDRVGAFDPRLAQQRGVQPVAMQHDGALQRLGGVLGLAAAALDHLARGFVPAASSSARATARPTLPPPRMTTRSCFLTDLPKISSVRGCRRHAP